MCVCAAPLAPLPPPTPQTLKDVSRERFDVNKEPTDPSQCWSRIRSLLLSAAVQASEQLPLEGMVATVAAARPADAAALRPDTGGPRIISADSDSDSGAAAADEPMKTKGGCPREGEAGRLSGRPNEGDRPAGERAAAIGAGRNSGRPSIGADPDAAPGGDAAAGAGDGSVYGGGGDDVEGGCDPAAGNAAGSEGTGGPAEAVCGAEEGAKKSPLEMYVDQCAWRVLHAASRTASGGDSFFVVQVGVGLLCAFKS